MGIFNALKCALIEFANMLIEHVLNNILSAIAFVIDLLPSVDFYEDSTFEMGEFGRSIGYFVPVGTMMQHFVIMLGLLLIWFSWEYVMRWIKMIK